MGKTRGRRNSDGSLELYDETTGTSMLAATTQHAAVTDLSMSVGVADGVIADVGAAFSQATLNNNFRDVGEKINSILDVLRDAKMIP